MNLSKILFVLPLSFVLVSGCGSSEKQDTPTPTPKVEIKEEAPKTVKSEPVAKMENKSRHPYDSDWGYGKDNGPGKWGKLSEDYKICSSGELQSPINLKWTKPQANTRKIEFDYKDVPLQVADNGQSIVVKFPPGSKGYFGGKQFELVNMHFHTSSEHTLSGNQLPMEAHLVHKNELGQISVVGIFLIEGRFNPFIEKIWNHIPADKHQDRLVPNLLINAKDLLPSKMTYYFYVGSLTTPPCTEGVRWHVLNTPVELSRDQIIAFRKIYSNNARPVQPLKARNVINY